MSAPQTPAPDPCPPSRAGRRAPGYRASFAGGLLALTLTGGCVEGNRSDTQTAVAEQLAQLTRTYDCGYDAGTRDPDYLRGALIYIPGRADRVAVVPAGDITHWIGPGRYRLDSWCRRTP